MNRLTESKEIVFTGVRRRSAIYSGYAGSQKTRNYHDLHPCQYRKNQEPSLSASRFHRHPDGAGRFDELVQEETESLRVNGNNIVKKSTIFPEKF